MSFIVPFTSAVPVTFTREVDSSSTHSNISRRSHDHNGSFYSQYYEAGANLISRATQRKRNWINRPRTTERRQSCRRVTSRRDWSGELEESEYLLPFPVAVEETERGGGGTRRMVSFRDELVLPRIDFTFMGQGLMIDIDVQGIMSSSGQIMGDDERDRDVEWSVVETDVSGIESLEETDVSTTDSEWTAFLEEAKGIEMLF
jgi:hypothetical protein